MIVKLGDICSFQSGGTPSKSNASYFSGDIPWITTVALNGLSIGEKAAVDWITEKAIAESAAKIVPARSIMVGTRVGIGKVAINEIPMSTSQDIISLVGINESLWSKEYLCKFIQSKEKYLKSQARGATIKGIKIDVLASLSIPDVPLVSQQKIVAILDKAQNILAAQRSQLSALDELIKARFVELFEDGESPLKTIEELCSEIVDCPHTTPKYEGELKNPAIRTSEIKKGYITWDSMRYVSDEEYEERVSRLRPAAGDIVYGREGTFGNAAVLPEGYRFCLGQRVMLLRPDYTKCTSEYLLHAVISEDVYRQAAGKNNASTVAHVNVKDVKQFRIPLPSFDKQNQFAQFVKQIDKSKSAIQKSLDETQLLFDSLMQQYFG